jgi:hypothetical protein
MTAGLQIWDANGVLTLDATQRCGRVKGSTHLDGSNGSIASDLSDGTPFWSFQPDFLYQHISNETPPPIISIDSNGIHWTYSSSAGMTYAKPITGWLFWGVF